MCVNPNCPGYLVKMYIPSAEMGEYDSVKPPPQKRMSSKQLVEAKYGSGSLDRQSSKGNMAGKANAVVYKAVRVVHFDSDEKYRLVSNSVWP